MHNSKVYLQTSDIAQGGCSSSMLVDLFLYHYECKYENNNLQLYRYIDIILISIDNGNCSLPVKCSTYLTLICSNLYNNLINFLKLKSFCTVIKFLLTFMINIIIFHFKLTHLLALILVFISQFIEIFH